MKLLFRLFCLALVMSPALVRGEHTTFYPWIHRTTFDRMDKNFHSFTVVSKMLGGEIAWGESYVLCSYVQMYRATRDVDYLRRFVRDADIVLANRDDHRGFKDYSGKTHAAWSMGGKYTVAVKVFSDKNGTPALCVKSTRYAYNDETMIKIDPGTEPNTYTIRIRNAHWKRHEIYHDVSLDPGSPNYIELAINDPKDVPDLDFEGDPGRSHSFLVTVTDLKKKRDPETKSLKLTEWVALESQWLAYHGYLGPILYPFVDFAFLVRKNPDLQESFGAKADEYVKAAEESVREAEADWREGPRKGEGYYVCCRKGAPFWCDNIPEPFNYLNAMGRVVLLLYDLTGKPLYLDRAEKLARLWKRHLVVDRNGAYKWEYWWGPATKGWTKKDRLSENTPTYRAAHYWEDISHAAQSVEFAVLCAQRDLVFTQEDAKRFAITFTKNLYFGDKKTLCSRVDGNRKQTGLDNVSAGRWLCLTPWDSKVYRIVADLYNANGYYRGCYGNLMLGIANLIRWRAWLEHR